MNFINKNWPLIVTIICYTIIFSIAQYGYVGEPYKFILLIIALVAIAMVNYVDGLRDK